jgi:hypothetical protein
MSNSKIGFHKGHVLNGLEIWKLMLPLMCKIWAMIGFL